MIFTFKNKSILKQFIWSLHLNPSKFCIPCSFRYSYKIFLISVDHAQKQFKYFCKYLSILNWLSDRNPENDTGLTVAKWVVSEVRSALISCLASCLLDTHFQLSEAHSKDWLLEVAWTLTVFSRIIFSYPPNLTQKFSGMFEEDEIWSDPPARCQILQNDLAELTSHVARFMANEL